MNDFTPGLNEALNCPFGKESFLPDEPTKKPACLDWHATPSQIRGLGRLNDLADVFVRLGPEPKAGYCPLTKSLIIGESGAGKSRLAYEFAKSRDWPFLSIDCGSWIPQGATAKPSTLQVVRDYLRKSAGAFSVLYLDEACKLLPVGSENNSSWTLVCWSEFLALADADSRLNSHEFTASDIRLLRGACYLIAGGAFTSALKEFRAGEKRGGLGFGTSTASSSPVTHSSKIREQLPEEISSRFHPTHIVLERPRRQDYALAIERIHTELKVSRTRPIKELLDEAEVCPGGMRWVEAYLTEVLVANRDCLPEECDEWKPQSPEGFDFFGGDFVHYAREVTEASFQLRGLLFRMNADLAIRQQAVERGTHKEFDEFLYGEEEDVQNKLLKALQASSACGFVRADDSKAQSPILAWRTAAWAGVIRFPAELARYSMLESFTKSWDLATRVCELRSKIARGVAAGRYGGAT
jgi:SpoVK/Ycf46/Vps4 family AAA+-type ATPase